MAPRIYIFAAILALVFCAPAWAQKRMALVIGNGDYAFEAKLSNPVNDARLIARTLRSLGFTVDERSNLRQRDMALAITKFTRESAGADTALLYFAGHGMQPGSGGRNYLLPVDANIESDDALDSDGIAADRMVEQMERSSNPAKLRLVVLDACRNNPRAGRTRGGVRGLSRMSPGDDYTLIAFSTNDQDVAQDGKGANSPYAEALSRHLGRAKELPLRRIFELTATDVRAATAQKQRPRTYGDLDSRVGLDGVLLASIVAEPVSQPAVGPSAAQVEQQAWEAAQRSNTLGGYEAYLTEYPSGRYSAAARVARAGLVPSQRQEPRTQPVPQTQPASACAVCPPMVVIPAGNFLMGSPASEVGSGSGAVSPQHRVNVSTFELGKTAVTQGQWKAVMGSNPSRFTDCGDDCPVEKVSWNDAQEFIRKLNEMTGRNYRLPSEAEWEYAGRAGTTTAYPWGDEIGSNHANCADCGSRWGGKSTSPVDSFAPNSFGLYDMHGNVWQWVQDVKHDNYQGAPNDATSWEIGGDQTRRMLRGGSWYDGPRYLRSASRDWSTPASRNSNTGFRIARTILMPTAPASEPAAVAPPAAPAMAVPTLAPVSEKVTFAATVYFYVDASNLRSEPLANLRELAEKTSAISLEVAIAVGHADSGEANPQKLSLARAEAVKAALAGTYGVSSSRIYTEGRGSTQPIADNSTAEGRARNRRVELEVVGSRTRR